MKVLKSYHHVPCSDVKLFNEVSSAISFCYGKVYISAKLYDKVIWNLVV
jgi:hypothetical protein